MLIFAANGPGLRAHMHQMDKVTGGPLEMRWRNQTVTQLSVTGTPCFCGSVCFIRSFSQVSTRLTLTAFLLEPRLSPAVPFSECFQMHKTKHTGKQCIEIQCCPQTPEAKGHGQTLDLRFKGQASIPDITVLHGTRLQSQETDSESLYSQNHHFSRKRKLDLLIRRKECLI